MRDISKQFAKVFIRSISSNWKPYSRLILAGDGIGWSLDWDIREIRNICNELGIKTCDRVWKFTPTRQSLFFASAQTISDNDDWKDLHHRIGFSYPQGVPYDPHGEPDPVFLSLCRNHKLIERVQVTHTAMRNFVLESGIDSNKVFKIPLGINPSLFRFRDTEYRQKLRNELGIPLSSFVVGSFQKDGVGWGSGLEPKIVKGPDVLIKTLEILKAAIPELFVLLVGPARGFVKAGLDRLNIPYKHIGQQPYQKVALLYQALDVYLVTSRQEGGPKAVLESLISGIPLVTTQVGQATDLIQHSINGWMASVNDVENLAFWVNYVHDNAGDSITKVLNNGKETAEMNAYSAQLNMWQNFMDGFVDS